MKRRLTCTNEAGAVLMSCVLLIQPLANHGASLTALV
jgi:hypothetical protein